ncbi:unnamed protein product [Dimorphilus gyrociliatus]|uniref:Uncharacterized protein n=1 Tax=Dimorphilus gyrociliatus TaxID=2664684 RepID=A0A7I8V508_9ANNE|nr:unnamed protein product [Dimorphilus gyrociliatus]
MKKENSRLDRKSLSERRAADSLPLPAPLPKRADFGHYYPDGGFGWGVLAVACLSHLVFGMHFAFGSLTENIKGKFKIDDSLAGWLVIFFFKPYTHIFPL